MKSELREFIMMSISVQEMQEELLNSLLAKNLAEFRQLLGHPAINPSHKYGKPHYSTCLEIACRLPDAEDFVAELLKKVKPNLNHIIPEPIHYAAGKGNSKALEILLKDKRTKVNAEDSSGRTALHHVAKSFKDNVNCEGYEKCVALLVARSDIDINRPNNKGYTAIHEAAAFANKTAVKTFLKYAKCALDLDTAQGHGQTAREFIIQKYPDLKASLPLPKTEGAILNNHTQTQLLMALKNRYFDVFCALLKQADSQGNPMLDPNYWYELPYETTCLETACLQYNCEEYVTALLQAGAHPNIVNRVTQQTPIHIAVQVGNDKALKILLSNEYMKLNVNVTDANGMTALHYAVEQQDSDCERNNGKLKCLELLLKTFDLNVNIIDKNNQSPISLAVSCENTNAVKMMLEQRVHGFDLDRFRGFENATIREIILNEFPNLVKYMPEPQIVQETGPNIAVLFFQHLYKQDENEFVRLLEAVGDNQQMLLNSQDGNYTLLQYTCHYGMYSASKALLVRGADPNAICITNKCPPAILACIYKHYDILQLFLLNTHFNINGTDMKGNSALHYAVKDIHLESVIGLLKNGADVHLRNVLDKAPFSSRDLNSLLDQCIKTNDKFLSEENYEVIFDYRLLTAMVCCKKNVISVDRNTHLHSSTLPRHHIKCKNKRGNDKGDETLEPEMNFLSYLSQSKESKDSLTHPVVVSFLELKRRRISFFSYINLIMYTSFLISLTLYITPFRDKSLYLSHFLLEPHTAECHIIKMSLTIFVILLFLRELFQVTVCFKEYFHNLENILDIGLILLTSYIVIFPAPSHNEPRLAVTITAILLSWLEMLLLTGRLPAFSKNIEMLKIVLNNYFSICTSYFILIFAFVLSFHTLFQDLCDYENFQVANTSCLNNDNSEKLFNSIPMSFLKIIIMMTGEFEADKMMFDALPMVATILFVIFVFLVAIVLLNLLIGLAVNDTKKIQENAELLCLQTQIKLPVEVESSLIQLYRFLTYLQIPCKCLHRINLFAAKSEKKLGVMKPNINAAIILSSDNKSYILKRKVLDSALKIINSQHRRMDENDRRIKDMERSMMKVLNAVEGIRQQFNEEAYKRYSQLSY